MKTKTALFLPPHARAVLTRLAQSSFPHEGCGVLVGHQTPRGGTVSEVLEAENLNRDRAHDRYQLNPLDLLQAEQRALELRGEVLGIWHSHPNHPAIPSETDRAAAWEGWSYLIVSVLDGRVATLRSWRLESDAFLEEDILS